MATYFSNFFFTPLSLKKMMFSDSFTQLLGSPVRENITGSSLFFLHRTTKLGEKCHLSEVYHTHMVSDTYKTEQSDQVLLSPEHLSAGRAAIAARCRATRSPAERVSPRSFRHSPPCFQFVSFPALLLAEPGKASAVWILSVSKARHFNTNLNRAEAKNV